MTYKIDTKYFNKIVKKASIMLQGKISNFVTRDLEDHKILLTKIDIMLPSRLTSRLAQYRSGRKQRVNCNNNHSEWLKVLAFIKRGSVLGPALFPYFNPDMKEYLNIDC
jgi:hypothetical protein